MVAAVKTPALRAGYDVAIVGGGHNGLAAAAYLARAGRSCVVLERRGQLGGAAVSERAFAGMDVSLSRYAYLVSLLPAKIVRELGLKLRFARRGVASYTPDPRSWGVESEHPRIVLCGAGARRGGGISCVAGHNAAMAVLAAPAHTLTPG